MKLTYHGLFWFGFTALGLVLLLAILWSWLSSGAGDWLEEGRYVTLSAGRYPPGTVHHFAFDEARPPRPVGFFLLVDPQGRVRAVSDRVRGCRLAWRESQRAFLDGCRGTVYPLERVEAGDTFGGDLVHLPVVRAGDRIRVDLKPVLPGR